MRTTIRTNIKDNENVRVKESVKTIRDRLRERGPYIMVERLEHSGISYECLLSKSTIKMVKQQKE